jgi:hypothetical protein
MSRFHVRVIGGWCGNRLLIVHEHLSEAIRAAGYDCRITHQSVWETYSLPPDVDLILQLMPAFKQSEAGCPVVTVKPLLLDLDDPVTMGRVFEALEQAYRPA